MSDETTDKGMNFREARYARFVDAQWALRNTLTGEDTKMLTEMGITWVDKAFETNRMELARRIAAHEPPGQPVNSWENLDPKRARHIIETGWGAAGMLWFQNVLRYHGTEEEKQRIRSMDVRFPASW